MLARRTLVLAHERREAMRPMVEIAASNVRVCVTCGFSRPAGWRVSRCPACWEREGQVAEANRRRPTA